MLKLDPDTWEYRVDNDLASKIFNDLCQDRRSQSKAAGIPANLCEKCLAIADQLSQPSLDVTYSVLELEHSAQQGFCDLCVLLWETCKRFNATTNRTVRFEREQSALKINGSGVRVLSLFTTPGKIQYPPASDAF